MSDFDDDDDYCEDDFNDASYHGQELSDASLDMLDDCQRDEYAHRHDHHHKEGREEALNDRKQHTPLILKAIERMNAQNSNSGPVVGNHASNSSDGVKPSSGNHRGSWSDSDGSYGTDDGDDSYASDDVNRAVVAGFETVNDPGLDGSTALIMAATEGNAEAVRALLQMAGADPNLEAVEFNEDVDRLYG